MAEIEFKNAEAVFYLLAWGLAALAGLSRQLSLSECVTCRHLLAVAANSGFLGFAVVAVLVRNSSGIGGFEFYHLAISAIVGLAGKEQEQIVSMLWKKLFKLET